MEGPNTQSTSLPRITVLVGNRFDICDGKTTTTCKFQTMKKSLSQSSDSKTAHTVTQVPGQHLKRILPNVLPIQHQEGSCSGLQDGVRIKVLRGIQYKEQEPRHMCIHCGGGSFSHEELTQHMKEKHEVRLRCTHCDFSCEKNEFNTMSAHYRLCHNMLKDGRDLFKRHQVPVSIPDGWATTLDFGTVNGLQDLPVFVVENPQREKVGDLCSTKARRCKRSKKNGPVNVQLYCEEVRDISSSRIFEDPIQEEKGGFSKWLPFFVSQESLVPLPTDYSDEQAKHAVMEKTKHVNFIRSKGSTSKDSQVPRFVQFLVEQYGDHHVLKYLTHTERVKKLKALVKDTGLPEDRLPDLVRSLQLAKEGSESVPDPSSDDKCVLLPRYGCVRCDYEALTPEAVKNHWVKYHVPFLPYQCVHCRMKSGHTKTLVIHILQMHPGNRIAFWVKTSDSFLLQLQLETDQFAPMLSDEDFRQVPCQAVGLYKHCAKGQVDKMTAIGYKVFDKWYCCHLCNYRTIHISALIKHNKICILPGVFDKETQSFYMCEFCKGWFIRKEEDLIRHQADSVCTPHVHKRDQVVSEVDSVFRSRQKELEKLSMFLVAGAKVKTSLNLDWQNVVNLCLIGETVYFSCKSCSCYCTSKAAILDHVVSDHKWPASFWCPCGVAAVVSKEARQQMLLKCAGCNGEYDLKQGTEELSPEQIPNYRITEESKQILWRCRVCQFTTSDKNAIGRHMSKHSGSKVSKCAHCGFMDPRAVVVREHISNLHRNCTELYLTEEDIDRNSQDKLIEEIDHRSKDPVQGIYTDSYLNYIPRWKLWLDSQNSKQQFIKKCTVNTSSKCCSNSPTFQCSNCDYQQKDWEKYLHHTDVVHGRSAKELKKNMQKVFTCVHYQCLACLYRCTDRSCMTRHVKYMHLQRFAHCCPYCNYGSVEKSKVRYHMLIHHKQVIDGIGVNTNPTVLSEMQEDVKNYFVKVDPENERVIPPKRKDPKVARDMKHLKKAGPRARALEKLLQQRKEKKLIPFGIRKRSAQLERFDLETLSKTSFTELRHITMLTVEAEKQMAWIETPEGILSVDFHGYVPKIEVLDTEKPVLKEGEDFEAFEVKWEPESESEFSDNKNRGNISDGEDQIGVRQEHHGVCSNTLSDDSSNWGTNSDKYKLEQGLNITSGSIIGEISSSHDTSCALNIETTDDLDGDALLKDFVDNSCESITCRERYREQLPLSGVLHVGNVQSDEVLHTLGRLKRPTDTSFDGEDTKINIKLEEEDIKIEDASPPVIKPIMVVKNQCMLNRPLGEVLHHTKEGGVDTVTLESVCNNSSGNLCETFDSHKRPFIGDCSYQPPTKLKRSDRHVLMHNNVDHPSVNRLLKEHPLLSVRTSVKLTDIMKHLLHLK